MKDTRRRERDVAAFAQIGTLVGRWSDADPSKNVQVEYRMSCNDSVLVETWTWPDRGIEALTLYHMDGDRLLATHYCPLGNQPRLMLDTVGEDGLEFTKVSVTNLATPGSDHNTEFTLRLQDDQSFVRSETYTADGVPDTERSTYRRR